ncbi:hypothetical protein [Nonomuraea lactucae]|uniref:hypothetical protein n=1 Tax=Nonomuraea lactucae TaxID=2249762 RepID=UPI0013B371F3|nr:hypothetical protein [Nonomuraea lactucae]
MSIEVKDVMGRVAIAVLADGSFSDIMAAMRRFAVGVDVRVPQPAARARKGRRESRRLN